MNKKIIFSSGGTGGHIFPAINLMKYFSRKKYEVLLVTDNRGKNLVKEILGYKSYIIKTGTFTNQNIFRKFLSLFYIFFSIIKSIFILLREKPDLVFGLGGYVSFPLCISSKLFNIPLVIYENNLIMGRANKHLSHYSKKILLGTAIPINFEEKYKSKNYKVGNILSEEIINYSGNNKKKNDNYFSILVLGGSQGAQIFGNIIPKVIKTLKSKGYKIQIYQQCLENQKKMLTDFYAKYDIKNKIFNFTNNILDLISVSDLAVSRSGASTSAELVHTCTPFIAIPYPFSTDNHQYLNAKYYENQGYCWVMEENNLNSENLLNLIVEIIKDKKKLINIRENMKKNDNKNVYNEIEKIIGEIIK